MKKVYFLLTQTPGINFYRCKNFLKHMGLETSMFPAWKLIENKNPNWQEVLEQEPDKERTGKLCFEILKWATKADLVVTQRVFTDQGLAKRITSKKYWLI
jgi:hypothetical protein